MSKKELTLTPTWEIRTTLPDEPAANAMAISLVESTLAACVQISGPIRSVYRWKGDVQNELEWTLSIKTTEGLLQQTISRISQLHPYEVPEICANPFHHVGAGYHEWLVNELHAPAYASPTSPEKLEPWHLQIQMIGSSAVKVSAVRVVGHFGFCFCDQWSLPEGPEPLPIAFEAVAQQLSTWPGMYFEMDGSFVWVSPERSGSNQPVWQLDGMVYDRNDAVQYIELKGRCDRAAWTRIVSVLLQNSTAMGQCRLAVHLINQSAWILESDFRKTIS